MHQRRNTSTFPTLLEPVCHRRQLPPTPGSELRRSSSPRILPTPPPTSPLSPECRSPSVAQLQRRASGRILPKPPIGDWSTPIQTSSPPIVTPDPTSELSTDVLESPLIQRIGDFETLDHSTPDGNRSQSSSLSPSIEQQQPAGKALTASPKRIGPLCICDGGLCESVKHVFSIASKSSSEGDDPLAHGLDPSLYGPNAPITCASPSTSDPGAVPSSSSFRLQRSPKKEVWFIDFLIKIVHTLIPYWMTCNTTLAGQLKPELEVMAMCKVSIVGLKTGKEQTSVVKRGRDPIFNQVRSQIFTTDAFIQRDVFVFCTVEIVDIVLPATVVAAVSTKCAE
uniref:C2 domain-containing protein n=1 Tax=Angiostrongylus cantonensis TaxID=6313 RepID=A0A158P6C2_ANGCA